MNKPTPPHQPTPGEHRAAEAGPCMRPVPELAASQVAFHAGTGRGGAFSLEQATRLHARKPAR